MQLLDSQLMRINKPLRGFHVEFTKDLIVLNLIYGTGKKSTVASIHHRREKKDTLDTIFDELKPLVVKEYLETHWD